MSWKDSHGMIARQIIVYFVTVQKSLLSDPNFPELCCPTTKKKIFECWKLAHKHFPVFLFKWVATLTMHTFSLEADVERMLLTVRLPLCTFKTCVRILASCCGQSLVFRCYPVTWYVTFSLPCRRKPVLRPNKRFHIRALQCVQSYDDMVCTVLR